MQRNDQSTISSIEAWHAMNARHAHERLELVLALRDARLTQTQAAARLGTTLGCLNNYVQRNGICWPVKRRGRKSRRVQA